MLPKDAPCWPFMYTAPGTQLHSDTHKGGRSEGKKPQITSTFSKTDKNERTQEEVLVNVTWSGFLYAHRLPCGSDGKESACGTGDLGSIPGWGRSPGEGSGYPLQYSCLKNSMDRGTWLATVCGVTKSQT